MSISAPIDRPLRARLSKCLAAVKYLVMSAGAYFLYYSQLLRLLNWWTRYRKRQDRSPRDQFPAITRRWTGDVQILAYHRIGPRKDGFLRPLPASHFERQMSFLARSCHVLALADAVDAIQSRDVPSNAAVITFDDGYADNFTVALPILRGLSLPATIFLVTGAIDSGEPIWHDRVFRAFSSTSCRRLPEFGPEAASYPLDSEAQIAHAEALVLRYIKYLDPESRENEIRRLLLLLEVADVATAEGLMLTWDQVRAMGDSRIEFGAHTVSHPILSRVSIERARREIVDSKAAIERETGRPVTSFAYPNGARGDFDESTKSILRESGFQCAVTTMFGTNENRFASDELDMFELRRVGISEGRLPVLAAKLSVYRW